MSNDFLGGGHHSRVIATFLGLASLLGTASRLSGAEKASEQVSPFAGSLSYSIPIEVPPFHGIEPRLSLTYSSEGRNGFAGVGWGVTGFSMIERVNAGRGAAFFDASDVYLLDGQKLVPCQGGSVSPSCTSGGTHSTEVESYLKIVRSGDTWTVYGRNGTKTAFAPIYTVPASAFLPGGILRWGQTSVTDTHNNVVSYTWAGAGGDVYPSTIQYNGYVIWLFRELRPDRIRFGASTIIGEMLYRLKNIFIYLDGVSQIRAYKLGYTTSALTGRSLLASVQQYGKDVTFNVETGEILSGTALPAQTFSYQTDSLGKTFQAFTSSQWCPTAHVTGDFNGDGRTDRACAPGNNGVEVAVGTATGFAAPVMWLNYGFTRAVVGDFNSDGKADLADYKPWTGDVYVALSTGTGFAFDAQPPVPWGTFAGYRPNGQPSACAYNEGIIGTGDFNGDGVTDLSCRNGENGDIFVGISNKARPLSISFWAINVFCDADGEQNGALDFDGNGMDDWYCLDLVDTQGFFVWPSTGTSFSTHVPSFGSLSGSFCPSNAYVFGDVNADGRADAACSFNGRVALSTGRHFEIYEPAAGPGSGLCSGVGANAFAADVDGDGASEIVCNNSGAGVGDIQVRKWVGTGLNAPENWKDDWCTGPVGGGDFNGDGKTDLFCDSATTPVAIAGTPGLQADLASSVANGLGGTIQFAYTASSAFPNTNNPGTKQTVTSLTRLDGRGGTARPLTCTPAA